MYIVNFLFFSALMNTPIVDGYSWRLISATGSSQYEHRRRELRKLQPERCLERTMHGRNLVHHQ